MSKKSVTEFYNNYRNKHIKDYIVGNRRLASAIKNLSSRIPNETKKIIDVGCGIGWSTHEIAKKYPDATVIGLDLSPILIETANELFCLENLSFRVQDISEEWSETGFDVVVLLDVYEHIPIEDIPKFHNFLKFNLKENGQVLLACPSIYHQNWLRNNKPQGLQPIDEDVSISELITLAYHLNAELAYFEYQHIWRTNDYFHAVIQTKIGYDLKTKQNTNELVKLENYANRLRRVKSKLGDRFDVTPFEKKKSNLFKKIIRKTLNKI